MKTDRCRHGNRLDPVGSTGISADCAQKSAPDHTAMKEAQKKKKKKWCTNVRGEPVFSVMVASWFCEKSGWIGEVEDAKPVLLEKKRISTGNHFEDKDSYPDELWNRRISFGLIHLGPDIIWFWG